MDPKALPFDTETILTGLRTWVECESPTYDRSAVNRMMDVASRDLALLGATVERIPGRMGYGDCVRAHFPHPRAGEPGILVMGHLDTVHPIGTLSSLAWRREGEHCYGPGVLDMKGGDFLACEAIRQLGRAHVATPLPLTVLFTCDEEVGSPSTRDLIEAEASRQKYILVPEPCQENGAVVTGRYAIARFELKAIGRPSHAGAHLSDGRSAVRLMARMILAIEEMTTDDYTFSAGVVHGGQWVNCVPTVCTGKALSMAKRQSDLNTAVSRMLSLATTSNDGTFTVTRDVTRPVWEPNEKVLALYEKARTIAKTLGFELAHQSAGGGSDANFTGALGFPSLDGLGVKGTGFHTLTEHIEVGSLIERGQLFAGLLATLT